MSNLDQKIETAANKIEAASNEAQEKRSFRIVSKSISAAAEIGLMIGAAHLSEKGYKSTATCLFALGATGFICDLIFNRKQEDTII